MRALLVVDVDATIKIYFKRAPFYNALIGSLTLTSTEFGRPACNLRGLQTMLGRAALGKTPSRPHHY
jgi:hypothetical protein